MLMLEKLTSILYITGNSGTLYDSVHQQILSLPSHFLVYPAHDYTGNLHHTRIKRVKTLINVSIFNS